jgi:hypothetical protein
MQGKMHNGSHVPYAVCREYGLCNGYNPTGKTSIAKLKRKIGKVWAIT